MDEVIRPTAQGEPAQLVSYTPAEPGWVEALLDQAASEPMRSVFDVYPVMGWAVWEGTDQEGTYQVVQAVVHLSELDSDLVSREYATAYHYFSRALHREAQGGSCRMSQAQLNRAVSE